MFTKFARRMITCFASGWLLLALAGCAKWNEPPRGDHVSGTIEVDETRLASRYGGRVEHVHAREGDGLKAGQVIVELAAAELKARREHALAVLEELKAGARKEELEAAKNDWQAISAELEFARSEQKRISQLFTGKAIAEAEFDRAVSRVATLEKS